MNGDIMAGYGRRVWLAALVGGIVFPYGIARGENPSATSLPATKTTSRATLAGWLTNRAIDESSGLAASHRRENVFWTHNDSGDSARLFSFDGSGKTLETITIRGASAVDWEDMCSFTLEGKAYLLVADVGDNASQRTDCKLYLIEEPEAGSNEATVAVTAPIRYEEGPRNCEAVAFDAKRKEVVLVSKVPSGKADVYVFPLPKESPSEPARLKRRQTISLPLVTSLAISSEGTRAVALTYTDAYEFTCEATEDWATGFGRAPKRRSMPLRLQGESITFGRDNRTLFLTSEHFPSPIWRVSEETSGGSEGASNR